MKSAVQSQGSAGGPRPPEPLRIVFLAVCGEVIIDVVTTYQVFLQASMEGGTPFGEDLGRYSLEVVVPDNGKVLQSRGGIALVGTSSIETFDGPVDTLLVAGSAEGRGTDPDPRAIRFLAENAPKARRVASVCTGAFLLAEAGLLEGKRATTHWRHAPELARRYPNVMVDPDPIYVRDGNVYTSAGMTAGMDLALALVEEDFGTEVALAVARSMVIYLRRPGGQSQFSEALKRQAPDSGAVRRTQQWVAEHLSERLSVDTLAEVAGMSSRNFARVFLREAGTTPAKYVDELRLEEARRMLEMGDETIDRIAFLCGYGSIDSLQRHFSARFSTTPTDFRSRFQTALRA